MQVKYVPLLQRDLYRIPRGQERFRVYLENLRNADASDIVLPPLASRNPRAGSLGQKRTHLALNPRETHEDEAIIVVTR